MKSTKKESKLKGQDVAPDAPMPVVVGSKRKLPTKRAIGIAALAVVVFLAVFGLVLATLKFIEDRKTITIGDTKITYRQQTEYADQLTKNLKKSGNTLDKSVNDTTYDALLLNAALKDQAKMHGITVTQADIDAYLKDDYALFGGKAQYNAAVKANGTDKITPVINENNTYESKLESVVLSHKDLFYVGIFYDSPYFNNSKNPATLRAQAEKVIKEKYLPLFESGASKETIASKADVNYLDPNTAPTDPHQKYYDGMPTTAEYITGYGRSMTFNDKEGDTSIPGVVSTNSIARGLEATGDHTAVVTTLAGWIGVMRAENISGGSYASWDALLKDYKQKYGNKVQTGLLTPVQQAADGMSALVGRVGSLLDRQVFPKAYAVNCADHRIKYTYYSKNKMTGAYVSGAVVRYNRSSPSDCPGALSGSNSFPINSGGTVIKDNCWAPAPNVSISDPNGYNRASPFTTGDSQNNFYADGTPKWSPGTANAADDLSITLNYVPKITWNMVPTSWGPSDASPKPGQQITFHHRVNNTGPDSTDQNISGLVKWTGNTDSTGGYGSAGGAVTNSGNTDYNRKFDVGLSNARVFDVSFTIPQNAKDGDRFCQFVNEQPTAWNDPSTSASDPVCAVVQAPNTPPTGNISIACTNPTTNEQTITYSFNDVDGPSKVRGRIGTTGYTGNVLSATDGPDGRKDNATVTYTDDGGLQYTLQVQNVFPNGTLGDWVDRGTVQSLSCKSSNHPPTGYFQMRCTDATNQTQQIFGILFSDQDGATDRKILRGSTVIDGPNISAAAINVTDSGGTLYQMQVKDATGSSYVTVYSMTSPTCSSTPVPSTISPTASIANSSVSPGDYVSTSTAVSLQGPNTHSNWTRTFWYDNNGNSSYESGTDTVISTDSQSNYYYSSAYNSLANSPATTVASGKTRICIQLNLSNATANDSGATTSIASNPSVDCRSISTAPPALVIYPQVSLSGGATLTPGDVITPTNMVIKTGGSATATSNWTRYYWYDTNSNGGYDNGEPAAVPSIGSSQTGFGTYTTSSTPVGSNTAATVNGAYTRLCVGLVLSNPNSGTTISPTSAVVCKPIQQPAAALQVDVTLAASDGSTEIEPGTQVKATATVTNPSSDLAASYYDRYFWYETNGNDATADFPYINQLQDVGYYNPGVTNAGPTWTTTVPSSGTVPTRICTSLALSNVQPAGTPTTPADGKRTVCAPIAKKPFVRVQMGDVFAGGSVPGASGVCGSGGSGTINTYNNGPTYYYIGSGTDVAAYARGTIDGFTSRGAGAIAVLPSGKELTFANVDGGSAYGGNSELSYCAPNYWDGAGSGNITVSSSSANIVKTNGNAFVTSSKKPSVDAAGHVTNLQWVIADNIYIDKNASQLFGVYIARKNIYTCSNGNGAPVQLSNMASDCNNALEINGALVAGNSVKLMRTNGQLKSLEPAETIIYSPYVWLSGITGGTPFGTAGNKYDYITALPPVL